MKANNIVIPVLAAAIAAGGGFFGGMKFDAAKTPARGQFQNLTAEQRQALGQRNGDQAGTGTRVRFQGNAVNGEIIAKDDQSITVKDRDGGSKIVFFSGSTAIGLMTEGTADDLAVGKTVTVMGTANSDGTIAAQNIQLRPAGAAGFPGNVPPANGNATNNQ